MSSSSKYIRDQELESSKDKFLYDDYYSDDDDEVVEVEDEDDLVANYTPPNNDFFQNLLQLQTSK